MGTKAPTLFDDFFEEEDKKQIPVSAQPKKKIKVKAEVESVPNQNLFNDSEPTETPALKEDKEQKDLQNDLDIADSKSEISEENTALAGVDLPDWVEESKEEKKIELESDHQSDASNSQSLKIAPMDQREEEGDPMAILDKTIRLELPYNFELSPGIDQAEIKKEHSGIVLEGLETYKAQDEEQDSPTALSPELSEDKEVAQDKATENESTIIDEPESKELILESTQDEHEQTSELSLQNESVITNKVDQLDKTSTTSEHPNTADTVEVLKSVEHTERTDTPIYFEPWDLEKKYYGIGAVAKMFDVNISHIRFWTNEFKLKPRTNRKGDRLYSPELIEKLRLIHYLVKEKGHTIKGAKQQLKTKVEIVESGLSLKDHLLQLREKLVEFRNQI